MKRGFRFQTGEMDSVLKELSEKGYVQMDIDDEREIEHIINDLKQGNPLYESYQQIFSAEEMAFEADFHSRLTFSDGRYIDLFHLGEEDESYAEISWG